VPSLFRRSALVRAEVAIHDPRTCAALLEPARGRWPHSERADRIAVGLGTAALAVRHGAPSRAEALEEEMVRLAKGVAAAVEGPLPGGLVVLDRLGPGGLLMVVPWEGPGRLRVVTDVVGSARGLVPRLVDRPAEAGPALEIAALALLIAVAVDLEGDRLALAFGIEGLLAWYREADRLSSPADALAFALARADGRIRETGGALPPGLH
jgi:hypothetical protein